MEAVVARDGKEFIIEVNDCATTLMGESQEEDRKNIAELVLKEMEVCELDFSITSCNESILILDIKHKIKTNKQTKISGQM